MHATELSPAPTDTQPAPAPQLNLEPLRGPESALHVPVVEPWPEPVNGEPLLNDLRTLLQRFVLLPKWAPEALALWILHTYASELRDVSTYIGIESPVKRCGKTTLLTVLSELVHRPVVAANISPSAFFRVIEQLRPTLLIDEADTALHKNDELRGILNAGYKRDTAYVVRVANQPSSAAPQDSPHQPRPSSAPVVRFSTWCPKAIAAIGHLPDTLADRCILIRMQRKAPSEQCERLRNLKGGDLRRLCSRFVLDHADAISDAQPQLPPNLHDRAADIWEPLLVLADLAGGDWPRLARDAALATTLGARQNNPIGTLFLDILLVFASSKADALFSRSIVEGLASQADRPWFSLRIGHQLTERWLADRLREYDIRPRYLRLGDTVARGYILSDFQQAFKRYISHSEIDALHADSAVYEPHQDPSPSPAMCKQPDSEPAERL